MAIKIDCFAYSPFGGGNGKCRRLNKLYCKDENCKFYKSEKQYYDDIDKHRKLFEAHTGVPYDKFTEHYKEDKQ